MPTALSPAQPVACFPWQLRRGIGGFLPAGTRWGGAGDDVLVASSGLDMTPIPSLCPSYQERDHTLLYSSWLPERLAKIPTTLPWPVSSVGWACPGHQEVTGSIPGQARARIVGWMPGEGWLQEVADGC